MRIALVSYASRHVVPLGLLYLAAALRQSGHVVHWIEARHERELARQLEATPCDWIGFSATTGMHAVYLAWADHVRTRLGIPVMFGGPHATFVPNLIELPQVDAVFIGEAESSIIEFLQVARSGCWGQPVDGVHYRCPNDDVVVRGNPRSPPTVLDELPWPAYDLVYDAFPVRRRFPVKPFLASRGCAYRCTYCANAAYLSLYGRDAPALRLRDPARVVDEMRWVERTWGLRLAWLADASLLTDCGWAEELVGRLRSELGVPFFCKVRPDHVDEKAAKMLASAGCRAVGLGIESGSARIRRHILGRPMADDILVSACAHLHEAGINVLTFNMLAIPTESLEEAIATLDLNVRCRADYAEAMLLQPYPGTPIATWAKRKGLYDGNADRIDYSYLSISPFREPDLSKREQLERLQRLFAVAVEFPEIRRALPWLLRRPNDELYDALFRVWYHLGFGARVHGLRRWVFA